MQFLKIESASGLVLLACTAIALGLANSPYGHAFAEFWHTPIGITIGNFHMVESLAHWVNDGLMTIFFFVVGLEIKRELVAGELRDPRKAALPIMAAFGGMIAPAAIYYGLQRGQPGEPGWGIPMATDIAFVVGFLALLGSRVPIGLKILLLSLAIADDIGAVLVIAVFYSSTIIFEILGAAAAGFAFVIFIRLLGVRRVPVYFVIGVAIWFAFLKSGVHPTVAGVVLGLMTPSGVWVSDITLRELVADTWKRLQMERDGQVEPHQKPMLEQLQNAAKEAVSPLERLEGALHPWVAYLIMPIFALANAGVQVDPSALTHPVSLAAAAGLVIGKPLGIVLISWFSVQIGIARLPAGVNWKVMIGAGCLAGIGFTMSLFVAGLAFKDEAMREYLDAGKIGTLTGSTISAILGSILLLIFLPKNAAANAGSESSEQLPVSPIPAVNDGALVEEKR